MTLDFRPWRRLVAAWLPAVILCVAVAILYAWQTSDSGGRRANVHNEILRLEAELTRLSGLEEAAASDRTRVIKLEQQFSRLYGEVFGNLDDRLTGILRSVGSATRNAGLLPDSYSYSARDEKATGFIRFSIGFSVTGEYRQIRQMLAELQASPEFLVVETLSLSGDVDQVSRNLEMSVRIATFLSEADERQLRRLTGGIGGESEGDNG